MIRFLRSRAFRDRLVASALTLAASFLRLFFSVVGPFAFLHRDVGFGTIIFLYWLDCEPSGIARP